MSHLLAVLFFPLHSVILELFRACTCQSVLTNGTPVLSLENAATEKGLQKDKYKEMPSFIHAAAKRETPHKNLFKDSYLCRNENIHRSVKLVLPGTALHVNISNHYCLVLCSVIITSPSMCCLLQGVVWDTQALTLIALFCESELTVISESL